MISISNETKESIQTLYPDFEKALHAFFKGELPANQYKGISGKFGSYAERGGKSGMIRLRFPGGTINHKHMQFLLNEIQKHDVKIIHFTTGEAIQLHGLSGETILSLYQEAFNNGIYCIGGGGDNPRNVTASPLRGIDPKEYFDITPYVYAASAFAISLIPKLHLPRKYKIGISNGTDNEGHVTFKDLGFLAKPNGTFDVYAAGGLGAANPQLGVKVGTDVAPTDILYYIDAFPQLFMKYGDYKNRGKNRSRFIATNLGAEEFAKIFQEFLAESKKQDLSFTPMDTTIAKTGPVDVTPTNPRIHTQKQTGLYYVSYHPLAGTAKKDVFLELLTYLKDVDGAEIRLNADETLYAVNLTAAEAEKVAAITANDTAKNTFESSVSCIGAAICQHGIRDSHGLLIRTIEDFRKDGVDTTHLPQLHLSGCPSSCAVQQISAIGFRGAAKKVDGKMEPAFTLYVGGDYTATKESLADTAGTLTEAQIPDFLKELAGILNAADEDFTVWYPQHTEDFLALVKKYDA